MPLAMLMNAAKASPAPRDFIGAIKAAAERTGKPGLIAEVSRCSRGSMIQLGLGRVCMATSLLWKAVPECPRSAPGVLWCVPPAGQEGLAQQGRHPAEFRPCQGKQGHVARCSSVSHTEGSCPFMQHISNFRSAAAAAADRAGLRARRRRLPLGADGRQVLPGRL